MTSVERFADQVGLTAAARWAAQQAAYEVETARPALRRAIENEARRLVRLAAPGESENRYRVRELIVSSSRGAWGEVFTVRLTWSLYHGFQVESSSSSPRIADRSRPATPAEVFQSLCDMECRMRKHGQSLTDAVSRGDSIHPAAAEYEAAREKFRHAVAVADRWFGINYWIVAESPQTV